MLELKDIYMEITCPKCEFKQDVPDEKIPPRAEKATCPRCGEKFRFRSVQQQEFLLEQDPRDNDSQPDIPDTGHSEKEKAGAEDSIWSRLEQMGGESDTGREEQTRHAQPGGYEVPWENLDQTGFFPGLIETIKRAMLAPSAFFYRMPLNGLGMPLAFFLLIAVVQALATFLWNMAGIFPTAAQHDAHELGMGMMGLGSFFIIIIYPLFMGILLFISSGITHIFLLLFQAGKSGFEGTFRATAYGSAPMILGLLPFLGPIIGIIWSLFITIVGYKNIHETAYSRVIMAMLTPLFLITIITLLTY